MTIPSEVFSINLYSFNLTSLINEDRNAKNSTFYEKNCTLT